MITNLDWVTIWSEDLNNLLPFYRDTLGLHVREQSPGFVVLGGERDGPVVCLGTHSEVKGRASDPYRHMFGLLVDDLDAEYRRLAAAGVIFLERPTRYTRARMATLTDPEGNIVQLYQAEAAAPAAQHERRGVPEATLDPRFSSEQAQPANWNEASAQLETAEVYWLSTVRSDGRPHVTPLLGLWLDKAFFFSTGPDERKARNLTRNASCVVTTGNNRLTEGTDLVLEGRALRVTDDVELQRLADAYEAKYGGDWRFSVRDGAFVHASVALTHGAVEGRAYVFQVVPSTAFAFRKGATYSQTRWRW
jgi:predicted enzyme related to lactoylglutathione lyase